MAAVVFNWAFLVLLLACLALTILFVFYFSRFFAKALSFLIRIIVWRQYKVWIEIESLQISFLAGRVFFKNIRYHGHNQTIILHSGSLTWRYWLHRVREAEITLGKSTPGPRRRSNEPQSQDNFTASAGNNAEEPPRNWSASNEKLPSRILLKLSGVELFFYNRSPAYDAILESLTKPKAEKTYQGGNANASAASGLNVDALTNGNSTSEKIGVADRSSKLPNTFARTEVKNVETQSNHRFTLFSWNDMLPVSLECKKIAVAIGNENTSSVLTAQADTATGRMDAAESSSLSDEHKKIFQLEVVHPIISLTKNPDFKGLQLGEGSHDKDAQLTDRLKTDAKVHGRSNEEIPRHTLGTSRMFQSLSARFLKSEDSLASFSKKPSRKKNDHSDSPRIPGHGRWQGLRRYLDAGLHNDHEEWNSVEYAKATRIADCPYLSMSLYWDVPGQVQATTHYGELPSSTPENNINGSMPPEYGLDLHIGGGTISYGPWADRERRIIQGVFFPSFFKDVLPSKALLPGETRVPTVFKLYANVQETVVLRIPLRESSKDHKWRGKAGDAEVETEHASSQRNSAGLRHRRAPVWSRKREKNKSNQNARPFGWLDVKILADSTVNYLMDIVPGPSGYKTKLDLDLKGSEVSSSVNHGILLQSSQLNIACELSAPCEWNSRRDWQFTIDGQNLEIFLLRDHIFLFTDLVSDWASGPTSEFFTFVPFTYTLALNLATTRIYLNTNDGNIINSPADLDDNVFFDLLIKTLQADIVIPLDNFRPITNTVSFAVKGSELELEFSLTTRNTQKTFLPSTKLGRLDNLSISGGYEYFSSTSSELTDIFHLDLSANVLRASMSALLVRHLIKLKDNYFGDDIHFKTLEELQGNVDGAAQLGSTANDAIAAKSNDLDAIISLSVNECTLLLPSNIYANDSNHHIAVNFPSLTGDVRITNYYMDLLIDFAPLSLSLGRPSILTTPWETKVNAGVPEVFLQSLNISGHRLFGLPVSEPPYICEWSFVLGDLTGELSTDFLERLVMAGKVFPFALNDDENTFELHISPVIYDVTFLRLDMGAVHICLNISAEPLLLKFAKLRLQYNDLAGTHFSEHLNLSVSNMVLSCVDSTSAEKLYYSPGQRPQNQTYAYIRTSLSISALNRNENALQGFQAQQNHLNLHDRRTYRAAFLVNDAVNLLDPSQYSDLRFHPPAMESPPLPFPVRNESVASSSNSAALSFATFSSSFLLSRRLNNLPAGNFKTCPRARSSPRDLLRENSRAHSTSRPLSESSRTSADSFVFSSPYTEPQFKLLLLGPNFINDSSFHKAPELERSTHAVMTIDPKALATAFEDQMAHSSLLVRAEPGIDFYCTSPAIISISRLFDILHAKSPADLLDAYQMSTIGEILAAQKKKPSRGSISEFHFQTPLLRGRFDNFFDESPAGSKLHGIDRFELSLDGLVAMIRKRSLSSVEPSRTFVYGKVESLSCSVEEIDPETGNADAVVYAELTSLVASIASSDSNSLHVRLKKLEVAFPSLKIDFLAALVQRTQILGSTTISRFKSSEIAQDQRMRCLVYQLTQLGRNTPDPPFMSRPSYALRATSNHIRSHNAWRIVSLLRCIFKDLKNEEIETLSRECLSESPQTPLGAESWVISCWKQRRAWEPGHVTLKSAAWALRRPWYKPVTVGAKESLTLRLRSSKIKLAIDPGPKQSEVTMEGAVIQVSSPQPAVECDGLLADPATKHQPILVHVGLKNLLAHTTWELVEFVEAALLQFQQSPQSSSGDLKAAIFNPAASNSTPSNPLSYHFVFMVNDGKINLDIMNLRLEATIRKFNSSFIGSEKSLASVLLHSHSVDSEVTFRSRPIWRTSLGTQSISVSRGFTEDLQSMDSRWKIVGIGSKALLQIKEEIHGLVEIANTIVLGEVRFFQQLSERLRVDQKNSAEKVSKPDQLLSPQPPTFSVAFLLGDYQLDVALLRSLAYSVSGNGGKISFSLPGSERAVTNFKFELLQQSHSLQGRSKFAGEKISNIQFPLLGGRLDIQNRDGISSVILSTALEKVQIDGESIYGFATVLNRGEVRAAFKAIRKDFDVVMMHAREPYALKPAKRKSEKSKIKPLSYDIRCSFSGLQINVKAPAKSREAPETNLSLQIHSSQIKVGNRSNDSKNVSAVPFIRADIQLIRVALETLEAGVRIPSGNIEFGVLFTCAPRSDRPGVVVPDYRLKSKDSRVDIVSRTASSLVAILNQCQDKIKGLDLAKEKKYLQRLRAPPRPRRHGATNTPTVVLSGEAGAMMSPIYMASYLLELQNLRVCWMVESPVSNMQHQDLQDLVLSFKNITLSSANLNGANLNIEDMMLQMIPAGGDWITRSPNSALLPSVKFSVAYASTEQDRRLFFQVVGKSLDLRLDTQFIKPANALKYSITDAYDKFRVASDSWRKELAPEITASGDIFQSKTLAYLQVDAEFAGAKVHLQAASPNERKNGLGTRKRAQAYVEGKYGLGVGDGETPSATLKSPGIAMKIEYKAGGSEPSLDVEVNVSQSSNTIFPSSVPLVMEISDSIQEVLSDENDSNILSKDVKKEVKDESRFPINFLDGDAMASTEQGRLWGRTKLNLGLRICKQEFGLSCQPIARVSATAQFDSIYLTLNNVRRPDQGHFFTITLIVTEFHAAVQHVYSRESTFSFNLNSIVLSLMNTRHLNGKGGISAILKLNPMRAQINAKQLQDFLLFREIWMPTEQMRKAPKIPAPSTGADNQEYFVQKYQQMSAATSCPWNVSVALSQLVVDLDLGQVIGKASLTLNDVWASSRKSSEREQNLCAGIGSMKMSSSGRMFAQADLGAVKLRTLIAWPELELGLRKRPFVQASLKFEYARLKAGFDFQPLAVADISSFQFLMFNLGHVTGKDRLFATLDGDKVAIFVTTFTVAQGAALVEAFQRLVQDNQSAFRESLKKIEKYLNRNAAKQQPKASTSSSSHREERASSASEESPSDGPITLSTSVVVALREVSVGAFPGSFFDNQVLLLEARNTEARFGAAMEDGKIKGTLGMTLGQLRVALAPVSHQTKSKAVEDLVIQEVISRATSSRAGTILRVPEVIATMQSWQIPATHDIEYIFKSSFEGKVDVGWNYSRVGFIRKMWNNHSKALSARSGKPMAEPTVKIKTGLGEKGSDGEELEGGLDGGQRKITAVVNVPQSKYRYTALEPAIIQAPQLRDMGEATPPMEWIGLPRDKLPNITHQVVIVALLEVAKKVEGAYFRILGSS